MKVRARYIPAVLVFIFSLPPLLVAAQPSSAWIDPSPHSTTVVTVDGVRLEVLDWGGNGRPILLLAGLGDTAHIFDDFAPTLTQRHRVYAVTRRGFGNSSAPDFGYDFGRLADDVMGVVDALGLEEPIIVGHSFAGEEMHIVGNRHASKVAGLVYIDAAFNRADDSADYDAKLRELPRAQGPQATDLVSTATLHDFRARNGMAPYPEAEVRNRYVVDPEGAISGPRMPAPAVREGISGAMNEVLKEYDPEPIRVLALAIYAVPNRPEDLMRPWYDQNDSSTQRMIQDLFVLARERYRRHAEWFQAFAHDSSRVVGMSGDHHLFVTNASRVKEEIETFASSLD
jgi:pimeloyl-ACP methyl ester carboxylesterase